MTLAETLLRAVKEDWAIVMDNMYDDDSRVMCAVRCSLLIPNLGDRGHHLTAYIESTKDWMDLAQQLDVARVVSLAGVLLLTEVMDVFGG